MRTRQKVSRAGVELIKSFEGLRSTAARLPDGRWTLGYGHTFSAREGARVTQEDADALLRFDLLPIVDAINNAVLAPLNQNQFDALVSFCFNIGVDNFLQSSVLKCINEGRITEAALAMDNWRSAEFNGQTYVLAPLIRRRAAEKNLFLTPDEAAGHAPSLLVRPLPDTAPSVSSPPTELSAPDRGGVLSAYPMNAPGFSPYAQPVPQTAVQPVSQPERQVIDLNAFTPRPADTIPPPYSAPRETVVEQLPDAIVSSAVMREAPVATTAPQPQHEESQMSPAVQAALARAQEELRLQEEQRQREEAQRLEAQRLEAQRQAEAAAAARAADEMRLQAERLEAARLEQARDLERAEAEQRERERQRAEQTRIEQEAFERARLERETAERERADAAAREAAERQAREAAATVAASAAAAPDAVDEAEKQRKAEAAAALMRLYSPYGAGGLGRPLSVPATPVTPAAPVTPTATPVVAPAPEPRPAPQEFSNQRVITPQAAESAPLPVREETPPPAAVTEEDDGSVVDFTPVGSARTVAPPTVVALNPYGRNSLSAAQPEPVAAPSVVEVPRPLAVDLSATPPAEVFALKPEPVAEPVHWRDQLQRPLPASRQGAGLDAEPQATNFDSLYHDDNEEWTMDGGRIAVASDDHHDHEHHRSVWQMIMDTLWWLLISFLGLGCLGVAAAAYTKSHDPAVIRNGFFNDYTSLSLIMAAVGILFVSISVWLIMKRLGGLKD